MIKMKNIKLPTTVIATVIIVIGCTTTNATKVSQNRPADVPTEIQVTSFMTFTATVQPTFTITPLPTFTSTPRPSYINMNDNGKGRQWCEPAVVDAGRIVIWRAIGRWATQEKAITALGDSWPPITVNGQSLIVANLTRSNVEWHTNGDKDPSPGWGFHTTIEIQLSPGVYDLSSLWLHDLKTCTLTVK